jgi:hypothetical protein
MPPRQARKPRLARHQDTTFRAINTGVGNDDWQRQADAAAWSAISGMPPERFLGWIEPIPVPPELTRRMREAAAELTAMPSAERRDHLLRLAHEAAYGPAASPPQFQGPPEMPRASLRKAVEADASEEWWAGSGDGEKPASDAQNAFLIAAVEGAAALANLHDDPANEGEVPLQPENPKEWWQ